jgi:hypothetical protein
MATREDVVAYRYFKAVTQTCMKIMNTISKKSHGTADLWKEHLTRALPQSVVELRKEPSTGLLITRAYMNEYDPVNG